MNGARLRSLDALRGFDMFWIMGLSGAVAGCCKLFPGGENSFLFHQMYHVEWEGLAFHDTIFPLFLFIAGASFPFSYASQVTKGSSRLTIHLRILKRLVLLVLLGQFVGHEPQVAHRLAKPALLAVDVHHLKLALALPSLDLLIGDLRHALANLLHTVGRVKGEVHAYALHYLLY